MGIPIPIRHVNHSSFPFLLQTYLCSKQAFLHWKAKHFFSPIGILVAGGVMGFVKGGSQKSLVAGGVSAALLCHVYTQLPERPLYASSLGLGMMLTGSTMAVLLNTGYIFFLLLLLLMLNLPVLLIRYVCDSSNCDGVSLQEVWKGIPCRCRVSCVLDHGRWLSSWNSA
ncbi:unnamed protein product [Musa textilis]